MKRIFFLLGSMNVGGVEKAFLNLIAEIPRDKNEIHLGLIKPMGGFMEFIPEDVKVYHIDCYDKYWDIINDLKASLKEIEVKIILLHLLEIKTFNEISKIVSMKEKTVKTCYYRALNKYKKEAKNDD